jgi:two-component system CheB/CheR fusion protein
MLLSRESGKVSYLAVLAAFGLTLALIGGSGVLAYQNAQAQDETTAVVIHAQGVLHALDQIETTMIDAETGQRGYLLTADDRFLEPWLAATGRGRVNAIVRPPVHALLAEVRRAMPHGSAERDLLVRAEELARVKLAELERTIALRGAGRVDDALAIVREGYGKRTMDDLRGVIGALRIQERRQLERSEEARRLALQRATISGIAGCVAALFAIGVLVVATRRAERALVRREREFRMLADHMSQHAWTLDAQGRFLWFNRRWKDYTGLPEGDLQAQWLAAIDHPLHRERVERGLRDAVAAGQAWEDTFPLRARDGAWRWFLVRAEPIRGRDGRIRRWFGTNTDIDDRLRLEQELKEGNRRKDEFIATLAHELRNPLAPIQGGLELMRISPAFPSPLVRTREIMHRQLAHLVRLIDDLLDVSRISSGRLALQKRTIALGAVIDCALESNRSLVELSGHVLQVQVAPDPLFVDGDPVRLSQVLANLLSNAAKYTPDGGHVRIVAEREGSQAKLSVIDDGIGVAPDTLPYIFDLFSQAPGTRDAVRHSGQNGQSGIGIGLGIARRLVEMHGGTLSAASAGPGRGSTFTIRLPLAESAPAAPASAAPRMADMADSRLEDGLRGDALRGDALRILILDDNVDAAQTLGTLLGLAGHDVTLAHTGKDAIALGRGDPFDIAFLDIGLPDMTGYDVARALRALPAGPGMCLVALTGWGAPADRLRSKEAGIDRHLTKPVTLQMLAETLPQLRLPEGAGA